jgi:hypothetical protein
MLNFPNIRQVATVALLQECSNKEPSMTSKEAVALVKNLRHRERGLRLRASVRGDSIVFTGGEYGEHSLVTSCSTPERVQSHWHGYVTGSGCAPVTKGRMAICEHLNSYYAVQVVELGEKQALVRGEYTSPCSGPFTIWVNRTTLLHAIPRRAAEPARWATQCVKLWQQARTPNQLERARHALRAAVERADAIYPGPYINQWLIFVGTSPASPVVCRLDHIGPRKGVYVRRYYRTRKPSQLQTVRGWPFQTGTTT